MITETFSRVVQALGIIEPRILRAKVDLSTSLVDDLGIDSIRLVDLTFAIQDCLGIEHFPTQQWVDDEMAKDGAKFTVGALVAECDACLKRQRSAFPGKI